MTSFGRTTYNDRVTVLSLPHLDGGGMTFGQDVVRFVRARIGRAGSVLEWCAGPGFIGFSLLAHGLCDRLTLSDINPEAVQVARETVRLNDLDGQVDVVLSDCFSGVPRQEFDLIVANPPHTAGGRLFPEWGPEILYADPGWSAHRKFFREASDYLAPGGSIVLQENSRFSGLADFEEMIQMSGLRLEEVSPSVKKYYFVWAKKPASC